MSSLPRDLSALESRQFASASFAALLTAEFLGAIRRVGGVDILLLASRDIDDELRQLRRVARAFRMLGHARHPDTNRRAASSALARG